MIDNVQAFVFPATFALLPGVMDSRSARAMLLAIGLQESGFLYRHQVGGPAHGFWQFEKGGGVKGVLGHQSTRVHLTAVCTELQYAPTVDGCFIAIEHNDTLACCFARLLLWTLPGLLAERGAPERGWNQYIAAWRPGKPHRSSWDDYFNAAWKLVEGTT